MMSENVSINVGDSLPETSIYEEVVKDLGWDPAKDEPGPNEKEWLEEQELFGDDETS